MRYDDKKKAEVVAFVKQYNEENGRGGQTAAKKKYKISPISIANWMTKAGEELPGKGGRKKAAKGKPGRPKGSKAKKGKASTGVGASAGSAEKKLARLSSILAEIEILQEEFDSLKKTL